MSHFLAAAAIGAALSLGFGAAASAEQYPRIIGTGENLQVDYGPAGPGNVVGGGRVLIFGSGEGLTLQHLDPHIAQVPRQGEVPVVTGSGEGATTVWVPAGTDPRRIALAGADGSLPDRTRSRFLAALLGTLSGRS